MRTLSLKVIKYFAQRQRAGKEKARIWPNMCETLEPINYSITLPSLSQTEMAVKHLALYRSLFSSTYSSDWVLLSD